jgi:acetyl esterase
MDRTMTYFRTHPSTQPVPLDPQLWAAIQAEPDRLFVLPLDEFRAVAEQRAEKTPRLNTPVQAVENRRVAGPDGQIPIRISRPQGRGPFPVLAYFHGGGWVVGTLDTHDDVCRALCHRAGSVVVSVDYRRAPESKYPAGLDDCWAVLEWIATNAATIDGDPRQVAVGGDSAGGNLAAAVAIRARDQERLRLALQVLIYPVTNYGFDTASYHENADGYGLSRDAMMFFWESYLADADQGSEPCASPLRAANLAGLPPALILTAQFDPLRDDGEAYAARLHRAGVPVRLTRYLDMNHGFLMCAAMFPSAACALQEIADSLKEAFRR